MEDYKIKKANNSDSDSGKRNLWMSILLSLLTGALTLVDTSSPLIYVRWLLGFFYVLFIPGFTLLQALYPKNNEIGAAERFALSMGLSIAMVPFIGYALTFSGIGVNLTFVTITLIGLSLLFVVIALFRRKKESPLRV